MLNKELNIKLKNMKVVGTTNTCFFLQNIEQVKRIPERSFEEDRITIFQFEVFKS